MSNISYLTVLGFIFYIKSDSNFNTSQSYYSTLSLLEMEGRIVRGTPVSAVQFPSSVLFLNYGAMCGGTIINSWSILTAAHCFDLNKVVGEMEVYVGSRHTFGADGDMYKVSSFVVHNNYNTPIPFACDIGLIFVNRLISFGEKSKKAIMINNAEWMNENQTNFVVSGRGLTKYYGAVSEQGLMMTTLSYVSLAKCSRLHGIELTPDMFCLYGDGERDTCKGDSGGGVLWNGMLVGIVSHGDGCAKKDKPSVYTNVWYFRDWIEKELLNFFDNYCNETGARVAE